MEHANAERFKHNSMGEAAQCSLLGRVRNALFVPFVSLEKKRYNRILFLALLAPALAWIPDVGLFLGLVLVHFIFLLWLYGKRRPLWVKVPWAVGMFYIPFLALILSGSFPYQLLL